VFHNLWLVVLIAVLSAALVTPARAESLQAAGDQIVIGIVVVSAAVAVAVTLLILHEKRKKSAVTGCVTSRGKRSEHDGRKRKTHLRAERRPRRR
jgi:predicted aspartyl protease